MNASLLYSIKLVQKRNEKTLPHSKTCTCESCAWLRSAQQLTLEFAARRLEYLYRSTH